jgi:uncharacterized membrane protein
MAPDATVTLLSTVAGATITTAGVVFSLLLVSLQLASDSGRGTARRASSAC